VVTDSDGEGEPEALVETAAEKEGETLEVGDTVIDGEPVAEALADPDDDSDERGEMDCEGIAVVVDRGEVEPLVVTEAEADGEADAVGDKDAAAEKEPLDVGLIDGDPDGDPDDEGEAAAEMEATALALGDKVSVEDGLVDGLGVPE